MYAVQLRLSPKSSNLIAGCLLVDQAFQSTQSEPPQIYGFEVGEHVFVDGHDEEFVVIDVDRASQTLQLLPVARVGRIESFSAASIRIVMPPKSKDEPPEEVGVNFYGDSTIP